LIKKVRLPFNEVMLVCNICGDCFRNSDDAGSCGNKPAETPEFKLGEKIMLYEEIDFRNGTYRASGGARSAEPAKFTVTRLFYGDGRPTLRGCYQLHRLYIEVSRPFKEDDPEKSSKYRKNQLGDIITRVHLQAAVKVWQKGHLQELKDTGLLPVSPGCRVTKIHL
jgi:hypothetical protein